LLRKIVLDLTQLLEELILVLVTIELAELAYHIYKMRTYEKKIDQHLTKMDAHILRMDQHVNQLENRMTKLDKFFEQESQEKSQ